jgi:probable phosphoglycerate mutase
VKTDTIYTSDLKRARDTAELIGKAAGIPNIAALPGLREMSLGAWDGRFISEIKDKYPEEYEKRGKTFLPTSLTTNPKTFTTCNTGYWIARRIF